MKYLIYVVALTVSMAIGVSFQDYRLRTQFEAISGVNWYSFNAAHDDCTVAFKEECKIYGGFAPLSKFR